MPIYVRSSGGFVAERVQPAPGSEDETRYEALAADPASGWRHEAGHAPAPISERPPQSAPKADWVAWAVHLGAEQAEAEQLTKTQLIEQVEKGGDS